MLNPDINRILKMAFAKAGISDGGEYSANCLRRGGPNAISRPAPILAAIKKAGRWKAGGYKSRLD